LQRGLANLTVPLLWSATAGAAATWQAQSTRSSPTRPHSACSVYLASAYEQTSFFATFPHLTKITFSFNALVSAVCCSSCSTCFCRPPHLVYRVAGEKAKRRKDLPDDKQYIQFRDGLSPNSFACSSPSPRTDQCSGRSCCQGAATGTINECTAPGNLLPTSLSAFLQCGAFSSFLFLVSVLSAHSSVVGPNSAVPPSPSVPRYRWREAGGRR
jgi:hypothetical protein